MFLIISLVVTHLGTIPGMAAIRPRLLQYSYQVPLLVLPCYDHCDVRKYHPFYSQ